MKQLSAVLVCLFAAAVASAQGTRSTNSTLVAYSSSPSAASLSTGASISDSVADTAAVATEHAALVEHVAPPPRLQSWWWVHAGVAAQVAGELADIASSWKQPEGNAWLAQSSGPFAGKFYSSGVEKKSLLTVGIAAASYAIAYKWPKARRLVGVFNMTLGAGFAAAAVNNMVQNPNLR